MWGNWRWPCPGRPPCWNKDCEETRERDPAAVHVPKGSSIMFRKRTDQVYSTLQQVQRRITEQAGAAAQVGDEFRAPAQQSLVTLQPLSQALPMQPSVSPQPAHGLPPAM